MKESMQQIHEEELKRAIEIAAKTGAKEAIKIYRREEEKKRAKARDKRLHDTRTLLKKYRIYKKDWKVFFFFSLFLSLAAGYTAGRFFMSVNQIQSENVMQSVMEAMDIFPSELMRNPLYFSMDKNVLLTAFSAVALVWLFYLYHVFGRNNFRFGEEHGSAKWGTPRDAKGFADMKNPDNNIILSKSECLRLKGYPKDFEYDRNKNVLIIGGSGSGKTRYNVKPNLMQLHSSYVITDPKGIVCKGQNKKVFARRKKSEKYRRNYSFI